MRDCSRLVSVVLSHLALLCGLVALPTVGQSNPLNVLNWIPPTSPLIAGMALCNFVAPTCASPSAKTSGTIPMWLSSDTTSSVPYGPPPPQPALPVAMVGNDPSVAKAGSISIDTKIIPIVFTYSTSPTSPPSYVFDPENNDACSPQRYPALNMVQGSPVIRPNKLLLNGVSVGGYQFGSQFQRANFGTYTIKTASNPNPRSPNYDISLSSVLVNAEEQVKHRIALGAATPTPPRRCPTPSKDRCRSIRGSIRTGATRSP
jgi:hypothetical protein